MDIHVTGKHLEITEPIRAYAQDKAARLAKFHERLAGVEVLAERHDRHGYRVELIARVGGHEPFVASTINDDLYACLDAAVDKMERQLHDFKEKQHARKH